jgi:hypothetical protein
LPANPQNLRDFQRAGPVEFLLQRFTGDELHYQVGQRSFAHLVDLHHVLVPDRRRGAGFTQEAFPRGRSGGQFRGHHLDGDYALQDVIIGS